MAIRLARALGGPCGMDRRARFRAGNIQRHGAGYALVVDFLAGLCGAHFFPRPPASASTVGFTFLCELQLCHRPWVDGACFSRSFDHQRRLRRDSGGADSRLRLHPVSTAHGTRRNLAGTPRRHIARHLGRCGNHGRSVSKPEPFGPAGHCPTRHDSCHRSARWRFAHDFFLCEESA